MDQIAVVGTVSGLIGAAGRRSQPSVLVAGRESRIAFATLVRRRARDGMGSRDGLGPTGRVPVARRRDAGIRRLRPGPSTDLGSRYLQPGDGERHEIWTIAPDGTDETLIATAEGLRSNRTWRGRPMAPAVRGLQTVNGSTA